MKTIQQEGRGGEVVVKGEGEEAMSRGKKRRIGIEGGGETDEER